MDPFINYVKKLQMNAANINNYEKVHIVLGNESCDLDSTVSSLSFAYYLNCLHKSCDKNVIVLPVMNVTLDDFLLRTENCYCLNKVGIDINWLIYGDINLKNVLHKLEVTLVDHHILSKSNEYLYKNVVQIFDHRPIDVNVSWNKEKTSIRIEQVGSCATLIADEILKKKELLVQSLASLLYETINFDTIGFKPEAGKVKDLDLTIAEKLETYLNIKRGRLCIFEELWSAHIDVTHLTPKQLLLKDLKIVGSTYIPGLPMLVEEYLQIPDIMVHINAFYTEKNCSVLVLMGLTAKDILKRDLAFFSFDNKDVMNKIIQRLLKMEILDLKEKDIGISDIKYFVQGNSKLSRKQLLPVIKEVLL